ncbi:MAG: 3-dehydroquinate synthase II [Desulfobacterales bacterium]
MPLDVAEILEIRSVGMGDRVCVDTCTEMKPGEGMLVGNASSALFLVHAESIENPYVAARRFGSMPVQCMPIPMCPAAEHAICRNSLPETRS